ncbi:hypothetical protein EJ06DRAFT_56136 [Trichodelitschia bisporula]|uniref:Uncharacterized protein n=1 Tax=Trichodelitschia bisporula TaxID=703511 RepID=A0A6G1HUW7_9PEZI|nr:hypothetical protein EJ06DRAFT_56136 [Trichodelitschia bisporula]
MDPSLAATAHPRHTALTSTNLPLHIQSQSLQPRSLRGSQTPPLQRPNLPPILTPALRPRQRHGCGAQPCIFNFKMHGGGGRMPVRTGTIIPPFASLLCLAVR